MHRPVPIGLDDFQALRERKMEYVDKSHLIREVLDNGAQTLLLPRPRRFGKTLAMTMLRCFFQKRAEDFAPLFEDLAIWRAGDEYRAHFQRYPTIFITFKDVKVATHEDAFALLRLKLTALFEEHRSLLDSGVLSEEEAARYRSVLAGTADLARYGSVLSDLSEYLHRAHGEKVVILIDEYDAPIHAGYVNHYARPILDFFRLFLTQGLKGNPHLFKAVLTGILRVAKESIFSGLNNLAVYTLLRHEFSTCFGFTEPEVEALLHARGRTALLPAVRGYYNGYSFGGTAVYNPWSILNFLQDPDSRLRPHWVTTSSNDLVHEALQRHAHHIQPEIEALLEGSNIEHRIDEDVVLSDLTTRIDAVWNLLVFSGYLRAEETPGDSLEIRPYLLSIPNREVRQVYTTTFRDWLSEKLGGDGALGRLKRAIFSGDAEAFEEELATFTKNVLSYHDTARRPEQVYHAFVIGLLAALEPDYEVRSNRESGAGRPDVILRPKQVTKPGAVLELKVAKPGKKTLDQALSEGITQLRERDYARELIASGVAQVHAFAVAFDGKDVRVTTV